MTKTKQVFISYATADAQFAHRLAHDLQRLGVQVWIAPESIRAGEGWVRAIERGLEESSHVVIVLTPEALKSEWVDMEREVAIARERKGHMGVIPLYVKPCEVPPFLNRYQMVSFRRDYHAGLSQLADVLGVRVTLPEPARPPRPAPPHGTMPEVVPLPPPTSYRLLEKLVNEGQSTSLKQYSLETLKALLDLRERKPVRFADGVDLLDAFVVAGTPETDEALLERLQTGELVDEIVGAILEKGRRPGLLRKLLVLHQQKPIKLADGTDLVDAFVVASTPETDKALLERLQTGELVDEIVGSIPEKGRRPGLLRKLLVLHQQKPIKLADGTDLVDAFVVAGTPETDEALLEQL